LGIGERGRGLYLAMKTYYGHITKEHTRVEKKNVPLGGTNNHHQRNQEEPLRSGRTGCSDPHTGRVAFGSGGGEAGKFTNGSERKSSTTNKGQAKGYAKGRALAYWNLASMRLSNWKAEAGGPWTKNGALSSVACQHSEEKVGSAQTESQSGAQTQQNE